tara:strand:- start:64 stop:213 length:150 start_codon:yes stop_codon:yes gene_type:complete
MYFAHFWVVLLVSESQLVQAMVVKLKPQWRLPELSVLLWVTSLVGINLF